MAAATTAGVAGSRPLVSATVALWTAQVVGLGCALVRGKFNALYLEPDGVGIISQLNYMNSMIAAVAVFGMWNGSIKLIAEARAKGDFERESAVRSVTYFYPVVAGVLFAIAVSAASGFVTRVLLGGHTSSWAVVVAAFGVPFALLTSAVSVGLQGRGQIHRLAVANTLNYLGGTAVVIALVAFLGLRGAVAGVLLTSLVGLIVFVSRQPELLRGIRFRRHVVLDRTVLRSIYAFGIAAMVLSVAASGTDLAVRTLIVRQLGITSNGLYQPVAMLSTQVFLALVAALATYLFPRLTGLYANEQYDEATAEVNVGVRVMLAVAVPAVILTIALAPQLLRVVYSMQFVSASSALTWQMLGEVFRALAWTVGAVLLPLGLTRLWLAIGLATLATHLGLTALLIGHFGLVGAAIAYSVSCLVNALLSIAAARRRAAFRFEPRTLLLVLGAVVFTAVSLSFAQLAESVVPLVGICLIAGWLTLSVRLSSMRTLAISLRKAVP